MIDQRITINSNLNRRVAHSRTVNNSKPNLILLLTLKRNILTEHILGRCNKLGKLRSDRRFPPLDFNHAAVLVVPA